MWLYIATTYLHNNQLRDDQHGAAASARRRVGRSAPRELPGKPTSLATFARYRQLRWAGHVDRPHGPRATSSQVPHFMGPPSTSARAPSVHIWTFVEQDAHACGLPVGVQGVDRAGAESRVVARVCIRPGRIPNPPSCARIIITISCLHDLASNIIVGWTGGSYPQTFVSPIG